VPHTATATPQARRAQGGGQLDKLSQAGSWLGGRRSENEVRELSPCPATTEFATEEADRKRNPAVGLALNTRAEEKNNAATCVLKNERVNQGILKP
jgi:hypothetical protein